MTVNRPTMIGLLLVLTALVLAACADEGADETADGADDDAAEAEPLTIYSGRSEELVGPLLDDLEESAGIEVEARYGDTAEMAAQILEEGENSPADLFFGQDAGALGALKLEDRLVDLPDDVLDRVDARFADPDSQWVGASGRARVIAYNTDVVSADDLPESLLDFTDPEWEGRIGWAPTNGSFQAHVTGLRVELGDETTLDWLEGIAANDAQVYENNTAIVEALGRGEVDVGFTNHYYLYRFLEEDPDFPVENAFLAAGDVGNLVNIAGLGVLDTASDPDAAFAVVAELLTDASQQYFADEVFEFPLVAGVPGDERLPDIEDIETPDVDLSDLEDLEGTLELLREAGLI